MKFAPYSFSRIDVFEKCPLKFKFLYIDKLGTFVPNLALEKGSYIHERLENFTKRKKTNFDFFIATPEEQKDFDVVYHKFVSSKYGQKYLKEPSSMAEIEFGMKKGLGGLEPCAYNDKNALFRGKIDHSIYKSEVMLLIDWKTGKVTRFPAPLQLAMYAVWAFMKFPEVQEVFTAFVYVEHGEQKPYIFKRHHLKLLTKTVLEKIVKMEKEEVFPKKETPLCNYCDFRKANLCEATTNTDFNTNLVKKIKPYKRKKK